MQGPSTVRVRCAGAWGSWEAMPPGWSVVVRDHESLSVRPARRHRGRFRVWPQASGGVRIGFFDRAANVWTEWTELEADPPAMVAWMVEVASEIAEGGSLPGKESL